MPFELNDVHRRMALLSAAAILCVSAVAAAQVRFFDDTSQSPGVRNLRYDGRFAFARLKYRVGLGGYYYRGLPAWAHGYPGAEENLMKILTNVSFLSSHPEGSSILALDDPQLGRYPVSYMSEAGFWTMTDREAAALRAYLLKGGFVIFDDFRSDYRGGGGWTNFEANMQRVIPTARFVDLDPSHPIFHAFFEINSFDIIPQAYDRGKPDIRGLFEDNDPRKRLMAIANHNTDISEYWEFSDTGFKPVDESNEAYELGVNYVMYGLTH